MPPHQLPPVVPESPTCSQLHPAADLVHGAGAAEEEEREAADAGEHQHHGHADEDGGSLEGAGRDAVELREAALTHQVPGQPVPDAVVEQTEVAHLRGVHAVPDPVGLDETHHVDDGEEDGEDGPQDADGAGVAHVVGLVDFGSLGGGEHGGGGGGRGAGGPRDHILWTLLLCPPDPLSRRTSASSGLAIQQNFFLLVARFAAAATASPHPRIRGFLAPKTKPKSYLRRILFPICAHIQLRPEAMRDAPGSVRPRRRQSNNCSCDPTESELEEIRGSWASPQFLILF